MAGHPIFDEAVLEKLQAVADALLAALPGDAATASMILRPGIEGHESEISGQIEIGEPPAKTSTPAPETVIQAGREFATAWLNCGHLFPAFQFACQRGEDGLWKTGIEPMQEW